MTTRYVSRTNAGLPAGVYKLTYDSGEVRYEAYYTSRGPDGQRHRHRPTFPSKEQAKQHLNEQLGKVAKGQSIPTRATTRTVETACAEYLQSRRDDLEKSAWDTLMHHLIPVRQTHGEKPVHRLNKKHLMDLIDTLGATGHPRKDGQKSKPWGYSGINQLLKAITQVLDAEMEDQGVIHKNVAKGIPHWPEKKKPTKTLTVDQLQQLFAACRDDRYLVAFRLGLIGLRKSEIAGLRWEDIDLEKGTIWVAANTRVTVTGQGGRPDEKDHGKSRSSKRLLELPPPVLAELRRTKDLQIAEAIDGFPFYVDSGYVVTKENGEPPAPRTIYDRWCKMLETNDLPAVTLHQARHTCGTLLALDGTAPTLIAAWLGHSDSIITQRIYMTPQATALKGVAANYSLAITSDVEFNNDLGDSHK